MSETPISALSVVVPVFNEEESLPRLLDTLTRVLTGLPYPYGARQQCDRALGLAQPAGWPQASTGYVGMIRKAIERALEHPAVYNINQFFGQSTVRRYRALLAEEVPCDADTSLLDLGCGTGVNGGRGPRALFRRRHQSRLH